eukprot:2461420-Alexandrium_andersonii.AAC.1
MCYVGANSFSTASHRKDHFCGSAWGGLNHCTVSTTVRPKHRAGTARGPRQRIKDVFVRGPRGPRHSPA